MPQNRDLYWFIAVVLGITLGTLYGMWKTQAEGAGLLNDIRLRVDSACADDIRSVIRELGEDMAR